MAWTFDYHPIGVLTARVNAVPLIVIALVILWEAWSSFQHPEKVEPLKEDDVCSLIALAS